ncbi:MAG TPA: DUF3568 family protein [Candidatus Synoicihabitans sp.]|nr:DUF3568 family protein [Candidatus Synoicihabitans sp.]
MFPLVVSTRRIVSLLLVAVALAAGGCRSGISAGEGPGIKGYENGELNGNVPGTLEQAKAAVEQTLVELGVLNAEEKRDPVLIEINARTLDDKPLQFKLSRISDELTKVRIRADDQATARNVFGKVRGRLQFE